MKLPIRGLCIVALSSLAALGGCIGPVEISEAREIAGARMNKYCAGNCGAVRFTRAQKIKDRWLIDYDGPSRKYTVIVEADGNSQVTVWDKN